MRIREHFRAMCSPPFIPTLVVLTLIVIAFGVVTNGCKREPTAEAPEPQQAARFSVEWQGIPGSTRLHDVAVIMDHKTGRQYIVVTTAGTDGGASVVLLDTVRFQ